MKKEGLGPYQQHQLTFLNYTDWVLDSKTIISTEVVSANSVL